MTEQITPTEVVEESKSLQDQVIEDALSHADEVLRSDDPQIVKARQEVTNQVNEWDAWKDNGKIDHTARRRLEIAAQVEARRNTVFDGLTGLLNRSGFNLRLTDLISRSTRAHEALNLLYVDLEGFKKVNDTLGHDAGDEILKKTADFLRQTIRASDAVARLGGDEFVVGVLESRSANRRLPDGTRRESAHERILREINENYADFMKYSYQLEGAQTWPHIGARIGVATYIPGESKQDFIARADADMNSKRDPNKPSR